MNDPAAAGPRSRLVLIVAGILALLGSFAASASAQAGYYGDGYYGSNPCSYRCGGYVPRYRYAPRYYGGCSSCGCYHHCGSVARGGVVYERRFVEREYVERSYGYGGYRRHYGYDPYRGTRPDYGYYPQRPYFPWGYGGVRSWRGPYSRYEPAAAEYVEEAPRPLAPVGYEQGGPYGY
jgi:hypothetical protein